jgi:hypothetical protein
MFHMAPTFGYIDVHPDRLVRSALHLHTSTYVGNESP